MDHRVNPCRYKNRIHTSCNSLTISFHPILLVSILLSHYLTCSTHFAYFVFPLLPALVFKRRGFLAPSFSFSLESNETSSIINCIIRLLCFFSSSSYSIRFFFSYRSFLSFFFFFILCVCACVLLSQHNPILPFSILLPLLFEKSPHSFKMSIYYYVTLHSCPRLNSSSTK